jgi:glycosyltransferase involved in cell wall biosynthesis
MAATCRPVRTLPVANAAIAFVPDAYDTSGARLMGRHAAGESFLRGYLRHAEVDRFYLWNSGVTRIEDSDALLRRIEPPAKPVVWLDRARFDRIGEPGCLFSPQPDVAAQAWIRRMCGARRYSICGVTHTITSHPLQTILADLMIAPVEPWDALICTSSAVEASIRTQLDSLWDYFSGRLGAASRPQLRLETIPLGLNAADFAHSPEQRRRWRDELQIPDGAVVALYVGRFSLHAKMNPEPMAIALERAARETGREIHWILCGWSATEAAHRVYLEGVRTHAPSVTIHVVDGRRPDTRFSIWSAGDIFLSLSDNIQETFGLTPVEAMAAGLPSVISDWDGYRDTVRHGFDGFRVPTYAPRPGLGADLAMRYAMGWDNYDFYVGQASMFGAPDLRETTAALVRLIEDPGLRAQMGASARRRAVQDFDWAAIVPRYQALWAELGRIRAAATSETRAPENPWKLDPFKMFASYPTEPLLPSTRVALHPDVTPDAAAALLGDGLVHFFAHLLPREDEVRAIVSLLSGTGPKAAAEIVAAFPPARQGFVDRGLLWLAKFGMVDIESSRPIPPALDDGPVG